MSDDPEPEYDPDDDWPAGFTSDAQGVVAPPPVPNLDHVQARPQCAFIVVLDTEGRWTCETQWRAVADRIDPVRDSDMNDICNGGRAVATDAERIMLHNAMSQRLPQTIAEAVVRAQVAIAQQAHEQAATQALAGKLFGSDAHGRAEDPRFRPGAGR